jgi:hypothetical protein
MDYPTLAAVRERIDEKVREMREVGGPALREKFAEKAAAYRVAVPRRLRGFQRRVF